MGWQTPEDGRWSNPAPGQECLAGVPGVHRGVVVRIQREELKCILRAAGEGHRRGSERWGEVTVEGGGVDL